MTSSPVAQLDNVQAWYGKVQALFGVSFQLHKGEALALVGMNGAGKTTTVRAIMGLLRTEGEVRLDGERVGRSETYKRARRHGVAVVHEGRGMFRELSVRENLSVGRGRLTSAEIDYIQERFPRITPRLDDRISNLSGGEQQMVALGRAMLRNPRLLILDEPSLGLAPGIVSEVYEHLEAFRDEGTSILLVEQSVHLARKFADRLCFLRAGRSLRSVESTDESEIERMVEEVFGSAVGEPE